MRPACGRRHGLDRVLQKLLAESRSASATSPAAVRHPTGLVASGGRQARVALRLQASPIQITLGLHWNITVLDPSALVPMFETTCCEPLFMQ